MCGIVAYWAKEAVLSKNEYDLLFAGASNRGKDGVGIVIVHPDDRYKIAGFRFFSRYSRSRDVILQKVKEHMRIGSILLTSFRATPETEPITDDDLTMIQPIVDSTNNLILTHNGGVTDSIKDGFDFDYKTKIDSEAILAAYVRHGRNMKDAMEELSGSFAFVMMDQRKEMLYAVCSFLPLAHMYVKGYGYFYHSDNGTLGTCLYELTGCEADGMNVWESWYHHDIEGYTIIETDIQSGFQRKKPYTPRFLHPVWDPYNAPTGSATKTFVVASGGIDSGLTARLLQLGGHNVTMLHFDYGQKSQDAEGYAIHKLSKTLEIPYFVVDLTGLYSQLYDPSMLLEDNIAVESGGKYIKSTIAWVAGRNAIFASIAMAFAEVEVLSYNYKRVWIAAGWNQLSEETGGYPDNSYKFTNTLEELKQYGYITGNRIQFLPVLQNLTKTECWQLGAAIDFPFEYTVSCDDPVMINGIPHLCMSCGSTKLSMIAADRAGVEDKRKFIMNERPKFSEPVSPVSARTLINRLILDNRTRKKLLEIV